MTTQKITLNKLYTIILKGNKKLEEKIRIENAKTYGLLNSQIKSLEEKITNLPTKNEFFDKMDEAMTELQEGRDDHTIINGQIERLDDRVTVIESHLKIPQK